MRLASCWWVALFLEGLLWGGQQDQKRFPAGSEPYRDLYSVIEGRVSDVRDGLLLLALDDGRFFNVDLSVAERANAGLLRDVNKGQCVRLNDSESQGRLLVAGSVDILSQAARRVKQRAADRLPRDIPVERGSAIVAGGSYSPIAAVREKALDLTQQLPNFTCRETVKRYKSFSQANQKFVLQDKVSTEVLYSNSAGETYRWVALNGRKVLTPFIYLSGSNSTGEFGSMLRSIFQAVPDVDFHAVERTPEEGNTIQPYAYRVARQRSDWKIESTFQFVMPAYVGPISVDTQSQRVVNIWRIAEAIPEAFPFRNIQSNVRYGDINIEGAGRAFLPVRASMTACQTTVDICVRNVIEFGRYKKYAAQSRLIFGKANGVGKRSKSR